MRVGADETAFALDLASLRLEPGELLAVTGPSGCGKSTLLEFLALLTRPAAVDRFVLNCGTVGPCDHAAALNAGHLNALARLRAGPLGYVPQSGGVLPFLSARAHADAGLWLAGLARNKEARSRFDRMTDALELGPHMGKTREQLSGGQRKRVSLLAGVSVPRCLLLADEPTSGLDDRTGELALDLLAGLATAEGTVVVIATHDAAAARRAGFTVRPLSAGTFNHAPAGAAL